MWGNTDEEYNIIEDIKLEEIKEFIKKEDINLTLDTPEERWAGFTYYYGVKNGLNPIESASFSAIISTFLAGLGVSAGTDYYYNEEALENKAIDIYNDIKRIQDIDETGKKRLLFQTIFEVYKLDIERYERKNHTVSIRLSEREYQKFMSLEGSNKTDKFMNLLNKEE